MGRKIAVLVIGVALALGSATPAEAARSKTALRKVEATVRGLSVVRITGKVGSPDPACRRGRFVSVLIDEGDDGFEIYGGGTTDRRGRFIVRGDGSRRDTYLLHVAQNQRCRGDRVAVEFR